MRRGALAVVLALLLVAVARAADPPKAVLEVVPPSDNPAKLTFVVRVNDTIIGEVAGNEAKKFAYKAPPDGKARLIIERRWPKDT